ncbi:MAG: dihydropteroate synthase [Nitrospirae bacterium]|nr:dihydropteroate synthase [Nitrospirota bacterium]
MNRASTALKHWGQTYRPTHHAIAPLEWGKWRFSFERTVPYIMGILNVTPDSFSDGGLYADVDQAVEHGLRMEEEGADLLDVGGESTRPGSERIPAEEEMRRILPAIERLAGRLRIPLSVDTFKPEVAREALRCGASLVNCVGAFDMGADMPKVVAEADVPVILMHMQGTPETMQRSPSYRDVVEDIRTTLLRAAGRAQAAGVPSSRVVIDPGIGFGKTQDHNLDIVRRTSAFSSLGFPVLVGPSRKSFIGNVVGKDVQDRDDGTLAVVAWAALQGVQFVRVHDVRRTRNVLKMMEALIHGAD